MNLKHDGDDAQAEEEVAPAPGTTYTDEHGNTFHVGRNEPCPCGSGKKFKQCHGKLK